TGWKHSYRMPAHRFKTARCKAADQQCAAKCVVAKLAYRGALLVGESIPSAPMHRFYVAPENWDPRGLALRGSEAHHARNVLRMQAGDKLVLFNGKGRELTAEIANVADHEIRLRKLHESETAPLRGRIVLGQAIPKGKNMDLIVQKAVEIGATEIAP